MRRPRREGAGRGPEGALPPTLPPPPVPGSCPPFAVPAGTPSSRTTSRWATVSSRGRVFFGVNGKGRGEGRGVSVPSPSPHPAVSALNFRSPDEIHDGMNLELYYQ